MMMASAAMLPSGSSDRSFIIPQRSAYARWLVGVMGGWWEVGGFVGFVGFVGFDELNEPNELKKPYEPGPSSVVGLGLLGL
jgi:hypothetical protein